MSFNFKETFLKLTEFTVPYGDEDSLLPLLPSNLQKDTIGNYFLKIGQSKTLFTCHLDTYCKTKEKVNHVIQGNLIGTDETTILGGDNKAGVTAILYLISQNVPGTYYFFIGEEPILSGGMFGSTELANNSPDFLKQFDRAVAFDRKKKGSIISRQAAQICCSDEFVQALAKEFGSKGVPMQDDKTGYYTDTGAFLELIPECTNISIGVWGEHTKKEFVDISYVETVAKAAAQVNWESLPVVREASEWVKGEPRRVTKGNVKKYVKFYTSKIDRKLFQKVNALMTGVGPYVLMNKRPFESGKEMWYNQWFQEAPLKIVIENEIITINGRPITLKQIENAFKAKDDK